MRIRNIVCLLIIALVFSKCKKDEPLTIVEGQVINYGSKEPIDSAIVTLQSGVGSGTPISDFGSNKTKGNGSENITYTDKNGYFKIQLHGEQPFLFCGKKGYTFINPDGGETIYAIGQGTHKINVILRLKSKAYFNPYFVCRQKRSNDDGTVMDQYCIEGDDFVCSTVSAQYGNKIEQLYSNDSIGLVTGDKYTRFRLRYKIFGVDYSKTDSVLVKGQTVFRDTIWY